MEFLFVESYVFLLVRLSYFLMSFLLLEAHIILLLPPTYYYTFQSQRYGLPFYWQCYFYTQCSCEWKKCERWKQIHFFLSIILLTGLFFAFNNIFKHTSAFFLATLEMNSDNESFGRIWRQNGKREEPRILEFFNTLTFENCKP